MNDKMSIRLGKEEDIQALLEIYNYEVVNGVATLDLEPRSLEEWTQWFCEHNIGNHPLIVAEIDGEIAGYATLSEYRTKEAFKSTVELSVYIGPDFRGKGVASDLMEEILRMAKEDKDTHLVVSVITSGNGASVRLHEKFGFTFCGTIPAVGYKHGAYQGIDNFYLEV